MVSTIKPSKQTKQIKQKNKQRQKLILASWNVRTLLDRNDGDRPERRSALVAYELSRYNIDIAALSEVRYPDHGQLTEEGAGYTFFWSGRPIGEPRQSGVGLVIKKTLTCQLAEQPIAISDRIITTRLRLKGE